MCQSLAHLGTRLHRAEQEAALLLGSLLWRDDAMLKGCGLGRLNLKNLRKKARPLSPFPLNLNRFEFWKEHTAGRGRYLCEEVHGFQTPMDKAYCAELRSNFLSRGESTTSHRSKVNSHG